MPGWDLCPTFYLQNGWSGEIENKEQETKNVEVLAFDPDIVDDQEKYSSTEYSERENENNTRSNHGTFIAVPYLRFINRLGNKKGSS